jgi:hypothetical protein
MVFHCYTYDEDAVIEVARIATRQPYVYRTKLKWYIEHPEQIETPQLHKEKYWWLACVFEVNGKRFVGNGNHRVCAALLLGWEKMRVWLLKPWRAAESAHKGRRATPWSMKTAFPRLRAQRGACYRGFRALYATMRRETDALLGSELRLCCRKQQSQRPHAFQGVGLHSMYSG